MIYSQGQWSDPVDVGHETDGDIVLAAIGPSLYLIHKTVDRDTMDVVSYNTADFNVVTETSDDSDDTTLGTFSPSEYPVAHFSHGPSPLTPKEAEPQIQPYQSAAPFAAAALDGVIHLAHPGTDQDQVQTETFSIAGVMTPLNKVDYSASSEGTSDGYGTLAEAGWSQQAAIDGVAVSTGAMSMSRVGSQLALLFQSPDRQKILISLGGYARS